VPSGWRDQAIEIDRLFSEILVAAGARASIPCRYPAILAAFTRH
jgi:hypothetical protein